VTGKMDRVVPTSYLGTAQQLVSVVVNDRATAIFVDLTTGELYQVSGVVDVWTAKPWSTCIRAADG
jgi:hypothetical protein